MSSSAKRQYNPTREEMKEAVSIAMKESSFVDTPNPKDIAKHLERENPTWKIKEGRVGRYVKYEKRRLKAKRDGGGDVEMEDDEMSVSSVSSVSKRLLKSTGASIRKIVAPEQKKKAAPQPVKKARSFLFRGQSTRNAKLAAAPAEPAVEKEAAKPAPAEPAEVSEEPVAEAPVEEEKANLLPRINDEEEEEAPLPTPLTVGEPAATDVEANAKVDAEIAETAGAHIAETVDVQISETVDLKSRGDVYADDNDGTKKNAACCEGGCVIF